MKKRIKLIAVCVVLIVLLSLVAGGLFLQGQHLFPGKIEVLNLKIEPTADWSNSYIHFTVNNFYNSPITAVGSKVNGVNYGYSTLANLGIPPGQSQEESVVLKNLLITNATNYDITITFTFDNGQYQVYSQSVSTIKYVSSCFITSKSLTTSYSDQTVFSVTIQNTGTIPLTEATFSIDDYSSYLPLTASLMPKETMPFSVTLPKTCQIGSSYQITIQTGYADGSTSLIKSYLVAHSEPAQNVQATP
jgi:hypothetical protein